MTGEEPTMFEKMDEACTLSYTTRIYGFIGCFCLGGIISFISLIFIADIANHPEKFAICFTFGNLIGLSSSAFLVGPWQQLQNMFNPVRIIATCLYLLSIGLTLYLAFGVKVAGYVIISLILQTLALGWYCLSYIPYGRTMMQKFCCSWAGL